MKLTYDLPEILNRIPEIGLIFRITLEEAERFIENLNKIEREIHTDTATNEGLERKEKMYGLQKRDTDTLEERRKRIEIFEKTTDYYSFGNISQLIKEIAGAESEIIRLADYSGFYTELLIKLPVSSEKTIVDIKNKIEKMLPVTMELQIALLFNRFSYFSEKTWSEINGMTYNEAKRYREET